MKQNKRSKKSSKKKIRLTWRKVCAHSLDRILITALWPRSNRPTTHMILRQEMLVQFCVGNEERKTSSSWESLMNMCFFPLGNAHVRGAHQSLAAVALSCADRSLVALRRSAGVFQETHQFRCVLESRNLGDGIQNDQHFMLQ